MHSPLISVALKSISEHALRHRDLVFPGFLWVPLLASEPTSCVIHRHLLSPWRSSGMVFLSYGSQCMSSFGFLLLWWNTTTKRNLGRKRFISLYLHITVHHQRQSGQVPGGSSWCRGHGEGLPTGLLPMTFSSWFLIKLRTASPGRHHPQGLGPPLPNTN